MQIPDVQRAQRTVTTDASGDADVDLVGGFRGWLEKIVYTKAATGNYDNGVDFTITGKDSGRGLWTESNVNASKTVYPSELDDDLVGVDRATVDKIWLDEDVNIVIAQGGNAKSGTFEVVCVNP